MNHPTLLQKGFDCTLDQETIKQLLDLQGLKVAKESDYELIQGILENIAQEQEKVLQEFPEIDDESIILTMDLEEAN